MDNLYTINREQRFSSYFYRFDDSADLDNLKRYDQYAANDIARAEEIIAAIKQYRLDLFAHTRALQSIGSRQELRLTRQKSWSDKKVTYYVSIHTIYDDPKIKTALSFNKPFPGTQRREAFALFEQMKRERPGVACVVDIDKKAWEK